MTYITRLYNPLCFDPVFVDAVLCMSFVLEEGDQIAGVCALSLVCCCCFVFLLCVFSSGLNFMIIVKSEIFSSNSENRHKATKFRLLRLRHFFIEREREREKGNTSNHGKKERKENVQFQGEQDRQEDGRYVKFQFSIFFYFEIRRKNKKRRRRQRTKPSD